MVSYFVRYRGQAGDVDEFYSYYETAHAKILRAFPNIQSLVLHRPAPWTDPFPVNRGDSALLVQMVFRSGQDLDAALRSEARRRARDDFQRFPPFTGSVTHEAMAGKVIF
jgi:EthD domain